MPGIVPRMNKEIFERLEKADKKIQFQVRKAKITPCSIYIPLAGIRVISGDLQ